jgi:hypothetical protein
MSEKETLESEIQYLENKDVAWWDVISAFSNETDGKILGQAFTPEQYRIIKALFTKLGKALDWHSDENDEPHEKIQEKIRILDAKLRNHRHELDKNFSSKAEF